MRKPNNLLRRAQLISVFVFATQIVQLLLVLYQKFQASNLLLLLYRPVCVVPGQKPKLLVVSRTGSYVFTCEK